VERAIAASARAPIRDQETAVREFSRREGWCGLDLETDSLDTRTARIHAIGISAEDGLSAVIHLPSGTLPETLRAFLGRRDRKWITHNGTGFDLLVLARHGVNLRGPQWFDTMIGEMVLMSEHVRPISLQAALELHGLARIAKAETTSDWANGAAGDGQLSAAQERYCQRDSVYLPALREIQLWQCSPSQRRAMDMEQRLAPIVSQVMLNGLPLDLHALAVYRADLHRQAAVAAEFLETIRAGLNPLSSPQVRTLFAARYDLALPNTTAETLAPLQYLEGERGRVATAILTRRRATKRADFYDQEWEGRYVRDERIHCTLNQLGCITGRFSASRPNVLQWPKDARHLIRAREGYVMLFTDYKAEELHLAAHLAQDAALLEAVTRRGADRAVAGQVFKLRPEEITPELRSLAKACSFALLYGGSPNLLVQRAAAQGASLTLAEAERISADYFASFPGLHRARRSAYATAQRQSLALVDLPDGRYRIFQGKMSPGDLLNTPIQSTGSFGLKLSLLECDKAGLTPYILAPVHDELLLELPETDAAAIAPELERCMIAGMEAAAGCVVGVESHIGPTWSKG
jgi:DNA polymerase I-like protein with 3'-5' exonuclease and polymerase domains